MLLWKQVQVLKELIMEKCLHSELITYCAVRNVNIKREFGHFYLSRAALTFSISASVASAATKAS